MADVTYPTPADIDATSLSGAGWTTLLAAATIGRKKFFCWYTGDQTIELSMDNGTTTHFYLPGTGTASIAIDFDSDAKSGTEISGIKVRKKSGGSTPGSGRVMAGAVDLAS